MAWRPNDLLVEGELDNRVPGQVTGWMKFKGKRNKVTFDLNGDFHRDIRGSLIHLTGDSGQASLAHQGDYMKGFATKQTGDVGDITAGLPPHDYGKYPYIEWYSDQNGRVVLELDNSQIEVKTPPIPWIESDPVDRAVQAQNMASFMQGMQGISDALNMKGIFDGFNKPAPNPENN